MSKCRLICWTIFYHKEVIAKGATGQIQEDLEVSEAQVEGIGFILKFWKLDRTIQFKPLHRETDCICTVASWFNYLWLNYTVHTNNKAE